jgi:hypothetical protein
LQKGEARNRHRETWDRFVSNLERDITKPNPIVCKVLNSLNQGTRENIYESL